jgi:hypothetical protein
LKNNKKKNFLIKNGKIETFMHKKSEKKALKKKLIKKKINKKENLNNKNQSHSNKHTWLKKNKKNIIDG